MTTFNPFTLEGKTILVTGASSGIGRGIAIACSKMGATVIINGRKKIFSEISKKSSNRYPDCKVVASGYKSQLVYTMPSAR